MAGYQNRINKVKRKVHELEQKQEELLRKEKARVIDAIGRVCLEKHPDWFKTGWMSLRSRCPKKYREPIDAWFGIVED